MFSVSGFFKRYGLPLFEKLFTATQSKELFYSSGFLLLKFTPFSKSSKFSLTLKKD